MTKKKLAKPILNETKQLLNQLVSAKVTLHNYRYPKNKVHNSGEYAIVLLNVEEVLEGQLTVECFSAYDGSIVVTGNLPKIEYDMEYIFTGKLVFDPEWGPQYECLDIHLAYNMDNPEDQKKFFSFFMTDRQVELLFSKYDNPVDLLFQRNIGALTEIKGIGPVTANRMCMKYSENVNSSRAYIELKEYGLTKNAIDKLIAQFGSPDVVVDIIKTNPYSLIQLAKGYGWERADRIALAQGFTTDCPERCLAFCLYRLEKMANEEGNSRVQILGFIEEVLNVCAPISKQDLLALIKERTVGPTEFEELYKKIKFGEKDLKLPEFFYDKDSGYIGLFHLRVVEQKIVDQLKRLKKAPSNFGFDKVICDQIIEETEKEQGFEYTYEQKKAIWTILNNNVSILTGQSGTGKSSTLKPLIRIFEHYGYDVAQCALSGRASSLLTEYTGLEGKTIHRLLNYLPDQERFAKNENNPLAEDVIILDETSMVGEELFLSLISSIRKGCKLIMLGDIKQLPPISVGNILSDCIKSGYIPTNTLTVIQRQALKSGIITQSIHICEGKSIVKSDFAGSEIRGELQDFKLISSAEAAIVHGKVIEEFKDLYYNKKIPADDIQIVVPVRSKGANSCRYFNVEVQAIVNATQKKGVTIEISDGGQRFEVTYKPGDRIMVTKNNYHARNIFGKEVAIFNGNMGHIIDIDYENMIIELNGSDKILIPRDEWGDITLAYACTCHKLQGSQARYVIVALDNSAYPLLMREWLYTAITRAREYCALIGQPTAINQATRVSNIKVKQTWIKDALYELYKKEH